MLILVPLLSLLPLPLSFYGGLAGSVLVSSFSCGQVLFCFGVFFWRVAPSAKCCPQVGRYVSMAPKKVCYMEKAGSFLV